MKENIKREASRIGLIFCATAVALAVVLDLDTSHNVNQVKLPEFPEIATIDAYYLFKRNAAVFVDMRSEQEFAHGHILGALSMPNVGTELQLPPTPPTVVIYGARGFDPNMSELGRVLRSKGNRDLHVLASGWNDWRALNLPADKIK